MPKNTNFSLIADFVIEESRRRQSHRHELERDWQEIDRQIAMKPDTTYKKVNGQTDPRRAWMPEIEPPLQASALEVLTADAREFMESDIWFGSDAEMTDDYLENNDLKSIIAGDKAEVPSILDQESINKLVQGVMMHWHRQYDFWGNVDLINAESFSYGCGVGRGRSVKKPVFLNTAKGVISDTQEIPILFPVSIKNTYLDNTKHFLMNEGQVIGPSTIFRKFQKIEDLRQAAKNGSTNPKNENGGWIPKNLSGIEGDDKGEVELLEFEGDLVLPKKNSGSLFIPNTIVTVLVGESKGQSKQRIIRFRLRSKPFSTYIEFPYHNEKIDSPYATSPLRKGYPLQKAIADALVRLLVAGQLNAGPPVSYDPDTDFVPNIFPYASWPTTDDIRVHPIGDISQLLNTYIHLLQQYSDTVGINAPRLGRQTVSHTTAFAKNVELSRGSARTIDYVKSTLKGPLTQWLFNCYSLGRDKFKETTIFIHSFGGFVNINKNFLPENVRFQAIGSAGPQEEQVKFQNKVAAIQQAMALEQFKALAAQGIQPTVNIDAAQREILREGGWTDLDVITNTESVPTQSTTGADPGQALETLNEFIQ